MSEWTSGTLNDVLREIDDRNRDGAVGLVLSVTEGRGIVPQTEVFKKRIATSDTAKYKVVRPLDIAWNPYLLWTGAVGQWLGGSSGVTSPVYPVFRANEGQEPRYWGLVLGSGLLTPYFDSTAVGSIQRRRRTTLPAFKEAVVKIPSLPEQRRIIDLMAAVDAQIEALVDEEIRITRAYEALLTDLAESGTPQPIGELVHAAFAGGTPSRDRPDYYGAGIPWLKSGEVDDDCIQTTGEQITDAGLKGSSAKLVPVGATVVAMYGQGDTKGKAGFVATPITTNQAVLALVPDEEVVTPRFLLHAVRSQTNALRSRAIGAAQPNLSKGLVTSHEVPVLSGLGEQRTFADAADGLRAVGAALRDELASLRAFRSTVLMALLNQELEIPETYDSLLKAGV